MLDFKFEISDSRRIARSLAAFANTAVTPLTVTPLMVSVPLLLMALGPSLVFAPMRKFT